MIVRPRTLTLPELLPNALVDAVAARRAAIEQALASYLPVITTPAAPLADAMRYAVLGGGKRLRPMLCMAAAEACGAAGDRVLPAACALELVHAFSLVHDDLPALDDDDLRRGRPTCHVQFGEAIAILAGDALLARAFDVLAEQPAPAHAIVHAIRVLASALGVQGMAGGQVMDLLAERTTPTLERVAQIHAGKTASLLRASTMLGAIVVGAEPMQVTALGDFGAALGLAFQMQDDLLACVGDTTLLGKRVGNDAARGKVTQVALVGVDRARELAAAHVQAALTALAPFDDRADPLRALARATLTREC